MKRLQQDVTLVLVDIYSLWELAHGSGRSVRSRSL